MKITISSAGLYAEGKTWSIEADSVEEAKHAIGYIKSLDLDLNPIASRADVVADVIDGDEATTGTQAAAALETKQPAPTAPKETTKQRARRKVTARTETVVDPAQIEISTTTSGKVVDLMDALKQSLVSATIAPVPTEEAVFEAVKSLAARKGVPAVHAVFAGFAIKKAGEIAVEKRGELIAALVQAGSESAK